MRVIIGLVGLVVLGEALALLVGLGMMSRWESPWLTQKNVIFLASDIFLGMFLVWGGFQPSSGLGRIMVIAGLVLLVVSHAYRTWAYAAGQLDPFCFNLPLFIVNNVKLTGLLGVSILALLLI